MITEEKSDLEKYFLLKKDLELPVKVRLYFLIFENAIDHTKAPRTIEQKKGFSKALLNAFSNMSHNEKGFYLLNVINYVTEQLDRQQKQKTKSDSKVEYDQIRNIQTTCQMLLTALKINYWSTVNMKLDKIKKMLSITNKKKSFSIDMKNYFVRRSNKYKSSIVLQAITQQINNQGKKYIFSFSQQVVGKIYQEMIKCMLNCQHQKILSFLSQEQDEEKDSHKSNEKALVFLSSKNINDYLSYKQRVQKQIMQNKFQFKNIFGEDHLKIEQSTKIDKVFRMENIFGVDSKQLKQKFIYALAYNNKYIINSQILQEFSKKYKALYQKLNINGRLYEYISIRQESLSTQQQILFVKGVQNIMGRNYIQFIQVRVRTINACQSKLIIYISIGLNSFITKQVVKKFMMEFNDMIFRKHPKVQNVTTQFTEENQENEEDEANDDFMTVKGSEQFVEFIEDDAELNIEQGEDKKQIDFNSPKKNQDKHKKDIYAHTKQILQPINEERLHKYMTQHYLFKDWVRSKNGGVICTNQDAINGQKKLFKQAITKMGKNILKGEILKMSLPIHIFSKQSHLESIARNFSFAPIFFDKVANGGDAVQRVKYASLLAVSVGTLGISMQKPFNPILGQTLQTRIDGCPVYLQQISHHPSIGAYLFIGRGFRIHGQIEPKVNFGLNNVKGFSDRPNFVQFDDGTSIQIIFGKMVIKGMLFGDREFNFQDRIYAYDKTNHIFSEIHFGSRKRSLKKTNDPTDFFYGSIYQLKPEFLEKFNQGFPRIYPAKEYIIKQLSTFEGIWNDQVRFDDKVYLNFLKDLPFEPIQQQHPLPSNSSYRSDLYKLIHGTLDEAQKQKDRLEQLQRRDKKLRQKMGNKHHS